MGNPNAESDAVDPVASFNANRTRRASWSSNAVNAFSFNTSKAQYATRVSIATYTVHFHRNPAWNATRNFNIPGTVAFDTSETRHAIGGFYLLNAVVPFNASPGRKSNIPCASRIERESPT